MFPEIGQVKIFYHSPALIVECVSEYTLQYTFQKQQTKKQKTKKEMNQKKQKKLKKKVEHIWKID